MRGKVLTSTTVNGDAYHYASWADSISPPELPEDGALPLLLVHGITASHMAWPRFARSLAGERHLLAPDLRARGKNSSLPAPFGFLQHIEDILRVMDAERVEQAKPLLPKQAVRKAAERNAHLETAEISDTNHYSILTGSGAGPVAGAVSRF